MKWSVQIEYDPEAEMAYIPLNQGRVFKTKDFYGMADYAEDGTLLGIEVSIATDEIGDTDEKSS